MVAIFSGPLLLYPALPQSVPLHSRLGTYNRHLSTTHSVAHHFHSLDCQHKNLKPPARAVLIPLEFPETWTPQAKLSKSQQRLHLSQRLHTIAIPFPDSSSGLCCFFSSAERFFFGPSAHKKMIWR
ncbi:hypothetical protein LEMLEM_LOCUS24607, partial [Lemmus lemmus]